jgi:hypothetical protein
VWNSTCCSYLCASGSIRSSYVDLFNERFSADADSSLCPHCVAGSVVNLNGFGCVDCAPGTFSNATGSKATSCVVCQAGTYNPSFGQSSCIACPAGTYNPSIGSTSFSSCISCPAGTFSSYEGSFFCTACPAGTYKPSIGGTLLSSCTACEAGTYNPSTGSASSSKCIPCPVGTYNPSIGQASCTACKAGTYNPSNGSTSLTSCITCPAGTYNPSNGSTSLSSCIACQTGTYNPTTGQTSCTVCQAGTYNPSQGQVACIPCPKAVVGFNCSLSNQSLPTIEAGFYIDFSRLSGCSEFGRTCDAIIKCLNPSACPGKTEKECMQTEDECYNSDSFGCTACCPRYFIENFVCKPCPASQITLILALGIVLLIFFSILSSCVDFPPFVCTTQSMKILLSSMQGFVSIRLLTVSWPPVVQQMLDFARFFTFNFNVIRPECTVDYTPQTKLLFTLIGPTVCALFIIMLVCIYFVIKCWRISQMLQTDSLKSIHNKSLKQTAFTVAKCLLTTSFCLEIGFSRIMVDGALWNALNPTLTNRISTVVLQQKLRRKAVIHVDSGLNEKMKLESFAVPEDWIRMRSAVAGVQAQSEFARSAKRIRLLVASALSTFIFTFQGSIESALPTFDCTNVEGLLFLRSDPKVRCRLDDGVYSGMVAITIIGLVQYCFLLPAITIIVLRSRWCREVYIHDNMAYKHLFSFLTSLYTKDCFLWELVTCVRKVAFVAIPVVFSNDTLVQSVAMFSCLLISTFVTLMKQPMASAVLNRIETISCISLIVSCFSSIFFVVEHEGSPVLSGAFRDLVGLVLVIVCVMCVLLSLRLMQNEYSSMPML